MSNGINFYEIKPSPRKRSRASVDENTFMNPGLDLLQSDDRICNNIMEVRHPSRKKKRSKSVDCVSAFENCALDIGVNKEALSSILAKELNNVKQHLMSVPEVSFTEASDGLIMKSDENLSSCNEPIYENMNPKNIKTKDNSRISIALSENVNNVDDDTVYANINPGPTITKDKLGISNLSFIDKLDINDSNQSNHSLCIDDDLNESNIMEIKTLNDGTIPLYMFNRTNPFLFDMLKEKVASKFKTETVYNDNSAETSQEETLIKPVAAVIPRRLFINDNNSTISTVNDSMATNENDYATIEELNEEPCYENVQPSVNKQSKILGHDVSNLTSLEILNLCNNGCYNPSQINQNCSNESDKSKVKEIKSQVLKASNKLSKKVFKKFRQMYKSEKPYLSNTLNPYEVPRKLEKLKPCTNNTTCFENPALKIEYSDESDLDDEEPTYETIKTAKNTMYNMTITPLKEKNNEDFTETTSSFSKKQVRFDATLNREKVITGNSFDLNQTDIDMQIEDFGHELENCINEKKIIAMNM